MNDSFVWRDAGRVVVFRQGGVEQATQLLREHGFEPFELLTTPRALAEAPGLGEAAARVHEVGPGQVPEAAAALLGSVDGERLVAFGGGRVVDVAKAVASVSGASVAAIPTTLAGAEITGIHRLPAGAEDRVDVMVRPALAIVDPEAMTSLPELELRASAMNSLAHGADSLYTPFANPLSQMAALRGAELIAAALDERRGERDRAGLAQGAVLCAYAIDSGGFAIHHVICQTLVRVCGVPHAQTNAAVLPHAMWFMAPRAPDNLAGFCEAIGVDSTGIETRLRELGGEPAGLGELGPDRSRLDDALDSMMLRPELAFTPQPPTREDLERLIESAW